MSRHFSQRHGYGTADAEITVREDAPDDLREEALGLLESCEWYKVYDIAEAIWRALEHDPDRQQEFEHELNRFFGEKGIGWELKNPDGMFSGAAKRLGQPQVKPRRF